LEVLGAEEAGGAAAKIEGLEGWIFKWLKIPLNPPLRKWETSCFLQDGLDVRGHRGLAVGEGIEVAVTAFPDAERDMYVETFHSESPLTIFSLVHFGLMPKVFSSADSKARSLLLVILGK
jgi:hypothetical protein